MGILTVRVRQSADENPDLPSKSTRTNSLSDTYGHPPVEGQKIGGTQETYEERLSYVASG